jgi:hypothetical protein
VQRLLELQQQVQQLQQQAGQQPQGASSPAAPQYQPQQPGQPVVLQPFDTGRSVVTFNLGGMETRRRDRPSTATTTPGRFRIKTNLLYAGATLSPNLSFEYGLGPRTSVEVSVGYNGWHNLWDNVDTEMNGAVQIVNSYKRRLDHVFGKAEFRYWLSERFRGHFFGAGALFADYSVGQLDVPLLFEKEYQYDGNALGGALTYGYLWRLHNRWAVEFSLSGGIVAMQYDKSPILLRTDSYELQTPLRYNKTYFGPTGAGIKLVFTIH